MGIKPGRGEVCCPPSRIQEVTCPQPKTLLPGPPPHIFYQSQLQKLAQWHLFQEAILTVLLWEQCPVLSLPFDRGRQHFISFTGTVAWESPHLAALAERHFPQERIASHRTSESLVPSVPSGLSPVQAPISTDSRAS